MSKKKISKETYLKIKPMADDLRKAEVWCELDGVLTRSETMYNLYEMGYRKLSDNVIELPCKVGQTVYTIHGKMGKVTSIHQNLVGNETGRWVVTAWFDNYYADSKEAGFECGTHRTFYFDSFGKTVFLTREEAEKALKGGAE